MKKPILILIAGLFSLFTFSQERYVLAGKVTLDDKGVENAKIMVERIDNDETGADMDNEKNDFSTTSNALGRFHFELKPGNYRILGEYTPPYAVPEELFIAGPEEIEIRDRGIEELEFRVVNGKGFIEANTHILEGIDESIPCANYKWGRVPVFSEEECKVKAMGFLNTIVSEEKSDVLNGASLGIPLRIYDISGNVVFYQFPIINLDTRIGQIGIHAIGKEPEESIFFDYPSISLKRLNDRLLEFRKKNFLMDSRIEEVKIRTAEKMNIENNDLMFQRFLSLGPDSFSFYIVFSRFSNGGEIIVDLNDLSILTQEKTIEEIREESEARYTLKYILDRKSEKIGSEKF